MDYLAVGKQAEERFRRAPGTRPPGEKPEERRAGDTGFADWVARVVGLPLGRFEQEGGPLEVRVPWHPDTLWFVPDERHAEMLVCEGVGRGRIWTAKELMDVMALPDRMLEVVRMLTLAKVSLDADIVEINRPERSRQFPEPGPRGPAPGR